MLSSRSTDEAPWEHIASDRAHAGRLVSEGHLRAEMGGGDGVGQEGEWWEQTYGGGNPLRMGRSGRKDYYEKITVSVGLNSECRGEKGLCTTVRGRFSD